MIGVTDFDFARHKEILEAFLSLAENGMVPPNNAPGHLDGWGIGYYAGGKARVIKSGGSAAAERSRILGSLKKIRSSKILILHLRKSAWDRTTARRHAHPFKFGKFIFAHNGTVYDFKELLKGLPARLAPAPDSLDTEVFFRKLIDGFPGKIRASLKAVEKHLSFSALNFLLSSGNELYAYRRFSKWGNYYTLWSAKNGGSHFVSSEKLGLGLKWNSVPQGKLLLLRSTK
jgi:glutamine amidotransferase